MLKRENRLRKNKDFEKVFKKGRYYHSDFLSLKIKENDLNKNRFAFVVSQKVAKKANVRNKIKRRLREIIRKKQEEIKPGWDVILITKPGIEKEEFASLQEKTDKLIKNAFKNN